MRRLVVLAGLLLALAVSSCGPQPAHLWVTPSHRLSACVSNDCGEWSVTLNWQLPAWAGTTDYRTYLNGAWVGNAQASPYTFIGADCGVSVTLGVQPYNETAGTGGPTYTTPYSTPACGGTLACDLTATSPSNLATQLSSANPGQVVCLDSGDYSSVFAGTSKSSPGITITSAPGATVTFNTCFTLNLSNQANWTLDGTAGGGTMTVGGSGSCGVDGVDLETSGDALLNKALNITFQNITFDAAANVVIEGPENSNITFNRDVFIDGTQTEAGTLLGAQFFTFYSAATPTTQSGVTLENSIMVAPSDLWNPNRAIEMVTAMSIDNNVFVGFLDHEGANDSNHIDTAFWYSGSPGTAGGTTMTGNLCYDDYNCLAGYDGTQDNTFTDNVCFDIERSCVVLYSSSDDVINHNTMQTEGADPSDCETLDDTQDPIQPCTSTVFFENGHKAGDPVGSGQVFTNNASNGTQNIGDPTAVSTNTNNLYPTATSPNISGSPTFAGGADPTTWAGFELTSGSTGHAAGSDGLDVGIRASAGGPPTGGGAAPVNTVAPAVTGAPTNGQTLTTTAGSWTITGNVPTATTYQWFDCPTSTFSAASCTPIEAQTAPASTNDPTYTLQGSDVGDYVFSEVTVTNANGQVNAISNAAGPIS